MLPPLSRAAASLSSPSRPWFSVGVPAAPAPGSVAAPPDAPRVRLRRHVRTERVGDLSQALQQDRF